MKLHRNNTSLRAFLAVELSLDLCRKIDEFQQQLRIILPTANWVRPESIHLTLKFLGYMEPTMVQQTLTAIEAVRKSQAPIELKVQSLGVFPDIRRPRILWTGCTGDIHSLLNFVSQIEKAMEPLGFPFEEKPYHPHLTLARIKQDHSQAGGILRQSGLLEQCQDLGTLRVDQITLFRSDLTPSGAKYTPLWVVPLMEGD